MPLSLQPADAGVLRVTASGKVTYREVQDLIAARQAERSGGPHLIFVDAREVTATPSSSELRSIVTEMRTLVQGGTGAIGILTSGTFVYGVVRMFSVFAQAAALEILAFRCPEEAQEWLARRRDDAKHSLNRGPVRPSGGRATEGRPR